MIFDLAMLIIALSFASVGFFLCKWIDAHIRVLNAPKPVTEKKKPPSLSRQDMNTITLLENIDNYGTDVPQKEYV